MRRTIGLLSVLLTLAVAAAAAASPPRPSSGTFSVVTQTITDSRQADGNTFLTVSRTAALTGTYAGSTTDVIKLVLHEDGSLNLRGEGVCTCVVDGRVGTFGTASRAVAPPRPWRGTTSPATALRASRACTPRARSRAR